MIHSLFTHFAAICDNTPRFFGLGAWYRYVPHDDVDAYGNCKLIVHGLDNGYWLIALGVIDILLRVSGMVAIWYIIYGGFKYIMSQGDPENTKNALRTITNALIGLIIVTVSVALVAFIARRLIV